jgi:outer membrane receptor protein involved in Fe transport
VGSVNAAIKSWGKFIFWVDLFRLERDRAAGDTVVDRQFGDRDRTAVSPKAAFLYHASEHVSLRAGHYQAFRTPTWNERARFCIWSATAFRDIVGRR